MALVANQRVKLTKQTKSLIIAVASASKIITANAAAERLVIAILWIPTLRLEP